MTSSLGEGWAEMLSLLCVTRAEPSAIVFIEEFSQWCAQQFDAEFVLVADGITAAHTLRSYDFLVRKTVQSSGFIESVLETAVQSCNGDYILRLDDDERPSMAMWQWLAVESYLIADHWKFPRIHLWPDTHSAIVEHPLFPDHQTRLSSKAKSGGRHTLHAGSPFGGGELAPVAIEHHKFLVKTREQREQTYQQYHGGSMGVFSLPELFGRPVRVVDAGDGTVPWIPQWEKLVQVPA